MAKHLDSFAFQDLPATFRINQAVPARRFLGVALPLPDPGRQLAHVVLLPDGTISFPDPDTSADLDGMTRLHGLNRHLMRSRNLAEMLQEILETTISISRMKSGCIRLLRAGGDYGIAARYGLSAALCSGLDGSRLDPADEAAFTAGGHRFIEDLGDTGGPEDMQEAGLLRAEGIKAVQVVPILSRGGRLLGLLSVFSTAKRDFQEHEIRHLDLLAWMASDCIDRARAEEGLRTSQAQLAAIFAKAQVGISEIAPDGVFQRVNATLCALLGRSEDELLGMTALDVTHPGDRETTLGAFRAILANGTPVSLDKRYVRPDGGIVWANSSLSLLRGPESAEPSVLAVTVDLTERRKAEADLMASELHLRLVMDSVRDYAIITTDAAGRINGWNTGAHHIFGYRAEEVLGRPADIIFTPEDRAAGAPEAEFRTAKEQGHAADERWHLHKDGRRFWISGVMSRLKEGEVVRGYVKVARDLTEQREAQAALRESEQRFRFLADSMPQIVWSTTPSGDAVYFNRRWFDYTAAAAEDSLGSGWQRFIHPEDTPASLRAWNAALECGEVLDAEMRLRGRYGSYRWFIVRNVPHFDAGGLVTGWFGTATDITERKIQAQELQAAHDLLESRVQDRTRELREAMQDLQREASQRERLEQERSTLMQRLVSSQEEERARLSRDLHDDLSQHMVTLRMEIDNLRKRLAEDHPELAGKDVFESLMARVDELIRAVHRRAWELRPSELDHLGLEVALGHYLEDWSNKTGIASSMHTGNWGDLRLPPDAEITLYRVLQEALANVTRHARASRVDVHLQARDEILLMIADNGCGFESAGGKGRLGLLGMRERMALLGGSLQIESSPESGTTIRARLSRPRP